MKLLAFSKIIKIRNPLITKKDLTSVPEESISAKTCNVMLPEST